MTTDAAHARLAGTHRAGHQSTEGVPSLLLHAGPCAGPWTEPNRVAVSANGCEALLRTLSDQGLPHQSYESGGGPAIRRRPQPCGPAPPHPTAQVGDRAAGRFAEGEA